MGSPVFLGKIPKLSCNDLQQAARQIRHTHFRSAQGKATLALALLLAHTTCQTASRWPVVAAQHNTHAPLTNSDASTADPNRGTYSLTAKSSSLLLAPGYCKHWKTHTAAAGSDVKKCPQTLLGVRFKWMCSLSACTCCTDEAAHCGQPAPQNKTRWKFLPVGL